MNKNKTVLIMGLGFHGGGVGAANYFTSKGARVVITDLKSENELKQSLELLKNKENLRFVLGKHYFDDFRNADLIIKNPGVPWNSPYIRHALDHGVPVETDIVIFLDKIGQITSNIIGVTGTKGKSTTASLLYRIFKIKYPDTLISGNITGSVFDIINQVKHNSYVILELSSFQLGGISSKGYRLHIGVFTNFMEDHLNYYLNMEDYFRDKSVLYRFQKKGDILVINRDNVVSSLVELPEEVESISFGLGSGFDGEGSFTQKGEIYYRSKEKTDFIMDISSVKLTGKHNLYNVLAAVTAAYREGLTPREIERGVNTFSGIEHRLEYIGSYKECRFYNDSAATTPDAAIQGISSFSGNLTLIAGGSDKNLGLKAFTETINKRVTRLILLEGTGTDRLMKEGLKIDYTVFDNLENAVYDASRHTKSPGTVLLSPGFASFGMFNNEFHRGNEFKRLVLELIEKEKAHEKRQKS